jgi:hypothetical protein
MKSADADRLGVCGMASEMFRERLEFLPDEIGRFSPAARIADRDTWTRLPDDVKSRLADAGDRALRGDWSILPASAYLDYSRTGNRTRFEDLYFARRRKLNALVLAECLCGDRRYLDSIVDGIFLICEESGWQLPAHNAYQRGGARLPLPDNSRPVIDLFSAETGAQLAVLAFLLESELDSVSPGIVQRINRELEHRIIKPYLTQHFWWMGNGDEPMNNWTAWCTQNVLLTVMSRSHDAAVRRTVVEKAAASLDAFLKDYGEDGACEEGALYYRHAGLCLYNALDILATVAPSAFSPLWTEPKVRNIADYIANVNVDDRRYFNFADCSAIADRCGAREYLFGLATGSKMLADFAATDFAQDDTPDLPDEINLYYRLQAAFTAKAMRERKPQEVKKADIYYPSIGLMIARDDRFDLAVKAGDNGDSHNHNDVGSVILYKNKRPLLIDVGVESYSARTFSPQRYDIWTMQSAYHNLPTFAGVMQKDGEAFSASDVSVSLTQEEARIDMDIAGAYPPEAGLRQYQRTVRLIKGHSVLIEDTFDGDLPATVSLMFAERPGHDDQRIMVGSLGQIEIGGATVTAVEEFAITDKRLLGAWPDTLFRLLLAIDRNHLSLQIT